LLPRAERGALPPIRRVTGRTKTPTSTSAGYAELGNVRCLSLLRSLVKGVGVGTGNGETVMTDQEPTTVTNLDRYGSPPLLWSRVRALVASAIPSQTDKFFLGTVGPEGRPHTAGVGALWCDGDIYVVSGPGTRKSRNLAVNPVCTIAAALRGMDVVFEGEAARVTDGPTLEQLATLYRDQGWPAEVEGEAFTAPYSAPSAGPPPWFLYRVTFHTVFGVASEEPHGATRWRFDR
jgi:hypothetical protein